MVITKGRVGVVLALAVALGCKGGGTKSSSIETSLVIQDQGDRSQAVFSVTSVQALADASLAFTLPQDCTVLAGAQRPQVKQIPAATRFERSVVFRCPEAAAKRTVSVALAATSPEGKAVQATDEATF